jgi:hypothetical protein
VASWASSATGLRSRLLWYCSRYFRPMRFHWWMHPQRPAPSRDPRYAWRLVREWLSAYPELWSRMVGRAREDRYSLAASIWRWSGCVCISLVIVVQMTRPSGFQHLREQADLSVIFMALMFVIVIARNRGASRVPQLMEFATALTSLAAVIVAIAQVHVAWQGRVLGYGFLLFGSARFAPKLRGMSGCAPESITGRMKWYLALWGLEMLAITMFAQAWSLTMPIRFRGDLPYPPVHGLLIVGVWVPALLAVVLIGWPAMKRLMMGGLTPTGADGRRRFFIRHLLGSLVLSSLVGAIALKPFGHPLLGSALGLIVGLVVSGIWEVFAYTNVVLRSRGPMIWGLGMFLIIAGIRGAVVGPSQPHAGPSELAAASLLWMGVWVEWRVLREVLGLKSAASRRTEAHVSRR